MKIRIISDGTPWGTKLTNAETGEIIEGVTKILWEVEPQELPHVLIEFIKVPMELVIESKNADFRPKYFNTTEVGKHFSKYSVMP